MNTVRQVILTGMAIVAVAACSGGGAAASITPPPDAVASVSAQNGSFVEKSIELPAGAPSRLFFRNLDGQPHNIAIYKDSTAAAKLFVGEAITNAAQVYALPALDPGSYFFRCDIHPDMTGTVKVGS